MAAASAVALLAGPAAPRADAAPPGSYGVSGIDTSHYNHPGDEAIDWSRVRAAGHAFMFAKSTEGATEQDRWFARDMEGAKEAGLIRGAYHLYGRTPGGEQARNLVKTMKSAGYTGRAAGELPPAIDLELRNGTACPENFSTGQLRDFLRVVDTELGPARAGRSGSTAKRAPCPARPTQRRPTSTSPNATFPLDVHAERYASETQSVDNPAVVVSAVKPAGDASGDSSYGSTSPPAAGPGPASASASRPPASR